MLCTFAQYRNWRIRSSVREIYYRLIAPLFFWLRSTEAKFAHQKQSFIAFEWCEPYCGWLGIFLK